MKKVAIALSMVASVLLAGCTRFGGSSDSSSDSSVMGSGQSGAMTEEDQEAEQLINDIIKEVENMPETDAGEKTTK